MSDGSISRSDLQEMQQPAGPSPARAAYPRPNFMSSRSQSVPVTNLPTTNNHDWKRYLSHRGISTASTSTAIAPGWLDQNQNQNHHKHTSSYKSNNNTTTTTTTQASAYREMTPNKDLRNSNKSAGWLQEELQRRTTMKQ
jgi:hypothetical protein